MLHFLIKKKNKWNICWRKKTIKTTCNKAFYFRYYTRKGFYWLFLFLSWTEKLKSVYLHIHTGFQLSATVVSHVPNVHTVLCCYLLLWPFSLFCQSKGLWSELKYTVWPVLTMELLPESSSRWKHIIIVTCCVSQLQMRLFWYQNWR